MGWVWWFRTFGLWVIKIAVVNTSELGNLSEFPNNPRFGCRMWPSAAPPPSLGLDAPAMIRSRRSIASPNILVWRANLTLLSAHSDAGVSQTVQPIVFFCNYMINSIFIAAYTALRKRTKISNSSGDF